VSDSPHLDPATIIEKFDKLTRRMFTYFLLKIGYWFPFACSWGL